jgi:hypothetical protein
MMAKVRTHSAVVASFVRHFGAESLQGYQRDRADTSRWRPAMQCQRSHPAEPNLTSDPERVRGGGAASDARQPHTKEGRGEGCDLSSFDLVRQLLHPPHHSIISRRSSMASWVKSRFFFIATASSKIACGRHPYGLYRLRTQAKNGGSGCASVAFRLRKTGKR